MKQDTDAGLLRVGVSVQLLGVPGLQRPDGSALRLERKDAALLAMLALDGSLPRARAADLLWPDAGEDKARANLRQRLFRLRRSAGREVVIDSGALALADDVSVDVGELPQQLLSDPNAGHGELLGAHDYGDCDALGAWVGAARMRWRQQLIELLAGIASRLEAERRIAAALPYAQRIVAEDPLLEHGHRRLMRLHYLRGDRAAALAAFEHCRTVLRRELAATPGPETAQLAALIAGSDAARPPAAPRPIAALRPPQLVGRDEAWRQLERCLAAPGVALISGEPGIGKSRLLADYCARFGQAALLGGARPGDARLPLALLGRTVRALAQRHGAPATGWVAEELARIAPELGQAAAGKLEPLRLQQALAQALAGWRDAGLRLLALDDLHFADEATLDLLPALVGESKGLGWLLAARAGELPARIEQWLQAPDALPRIELAPLDAPAVRALLQSLPIAGFDPERWAAPLHRHAGGNPLFILETLLAMLDARADGDAPLTLQQAPAQVSQLIERRLAQLSPGALKLARLAAIAGQDFSVELAADVLAQHPLDIADHWRELEAALVIRDGAFAHDLVFETTLRSVPAAIARALHHDIAARLHGRQAPPGRIAAHWDAAGQWAAAAAAYEAAAAQAQARSARRDELQALDAAARCHRALNTPAGDAAAFDCDWRGAHVLLGLQSADAALQRAEQLLAGAADARQRACALEAKARVLNERYDSEPALQAAQAAQTLARECGDTRLVLLAAQRAAMALTRLGRIADAVAEFDAHAGELAALSADERLYWLSDRATALEYADRRRDALQAFRRTIEEAERLGHWAAASEAWCNASLSLMYLGRLADSVHSARRGLECGERAGADRCGLLIDRMNLAGGLRDSGRFTDYLQLAEPLPQQLREAGHAAWATNAENDLATCYCWLGRPELAGRALGPLPAELPPMLRAARLFTQARLQRSWGLAGVGKPPPAALVAEACALIEASGQAGRSYVRLRIALEALRDAPPEPALRQVAAIETEAAAGEQLMLARHAQLLRIELLLGAGDAGAAAVAAEALLQQCERDGMPPGVYAPELCWTLHRALRAQRPARAAEALGRARQWIEQAQLPEPFRRSFVERNAVNAAVLAQASRSGGSR